MKRSNLKKLRLLAGKTQSEVANAVGTSQPNYQRWESEKSQIPKSKANKLAKIFETSIEEVLGEPIKYDYLGIDPEVSSDRTYYGEVALHFLSGGSPLLLPISDDEVDNICEKFESGTSFFSISSLDNRLIFVRHEALADIYFTNDAVGEELGPEKYDDFYGYGSDNDFWLVLQHIDKSDGKYEVHYCGDDLKEEYVEKIFDEMLITDKKIDPLIAKGAIKLSEKSELQSRAEKKFDALIHRAKHVTWQLSNGKIRHHPIYDEKDALLNIDSLVTNADFENGLHIPFEGDDRIVLINKKALDYVLLYSEMF